MRISANDDNIGSGVALHVEGVGAPGGEPHQPEIIHFVRDYSILSTLR